MDSRWTYTKPHTNIPTKIHVKCPYVEVGASSFSESRSWRMTLFPAHSRCSTIFGLVAPEFYRSCDWGRVGPAVPLQDLDGSMREESLFLSLLLLSSNQSHRASPPLLLFSELGYWYSASWMLRTFGGIVVQHYHHVF